MTSLYFNLKSKLFIVRKHIKKGMCSPFRIDASDEKNIRVLFYTFTFNKSDEGFVTLHTMK